MYLYRDSTRATAAVDPEEHLRLGPCGATHAVACHHSALTMVSADNTSNTIIREGRATAHTSRKNAAKNRNSMQQYGHMRWLCQLQAQVGPHHDTGVPLALHRVAHLLQPRSTQLKLAQHLYAQRFQSYSGSAGRSMKAPKLYPICNSPVNLHPLQQPVSIQGVVGCSVQPHSVCLCMH
jgi:hypothetical protein